MGEVKVEIINGKEYIVTYNENGIPLIHGNPQKDQAEAIAKATAEAQKELINSQNNKIIKEENYFNTDDLDDDEQEEVDNLLKVDKLSPAQSIIESMKRNGDYDIDPRFGAPRFYNGTAIRTKEYDEYLDKIGHESYVEGQKYLKRLNFWKKFLIIVPIMLVGLAITGYIFYEIFFAPVV